MPVGLDHLRAEISAISPASWQGRITETGPGALRVAGLSQVGALGQLVEIIRGDGATIGGEIVAMDEHSVSILPDAQIDGVQVDDRVRLAGDISIAPDDSWLGRMIDPCGRSIDDHPIMRGGQARPLKGQPINPARRRGLGERLETGLAVFNTMLPIARGQRIGLFAGSGIGKSTLLGSLVLGVQADVVVIAMIGERGREVREFVERILGRIGMSRTIVVAATSDLSPLLRRRCAWTAMAVAEHFRDQGLHVLFVADLVTRFAEAHREVALASGERGSLRGFPPSTASTLTMLAERAGPGAGGAGDITAVFSVLVAASDMEEPIADMLRGVLDGHVVLDRRIAERGRFPAVDLLRSVSRSLPHAASDAENELIALARRRLGTYEKHEMMIQAGLYSKGTDAEIDAAIDIWPALDHFVSESELTDTANSFRRLGGILTVPQKDP